MVKLKENLIAIKAKSLASLSHGLIIPPKNKVLGGYIGVTVSVGSHILSGLFLTNHLVEFNEILHEASITRGDVHTLNVLQLHVILQSYGPLYFLFAGINYTR